MHARVTRTTAGGTATPSVARHAAAPARTRQAGALHQWSSIAIERVPAPRSNVLQFKKCLECGHNHQSAPCKTKVPVDLTDKSKGTRDCNCMSHSGHWKDPPKKNFGSGKRARMLESKGSSAVK